MKTRKILPLLLALMIALIPACAEETNEYEQHPPVEVDEFDLETTEPEPEATPEPTAAQTPLPTLEPGSINYPADKVNFEGEIWSILTRRWGLKDYQAAGLMSSLYAESSFCPYNAQSHEGVDDRAHYEFRADDNVGFGLGQWTSAGRKAALLRYAEDCGDVNLVWDFDVQMGYMKSEISLKALKRAETLYEATEWAVMRYERPNQAYANSWPGNRYRIALQIFKAHTGRAYEEPTLEFEVKTADGANALEGFILFGEGELTVTSNYYWRLSYRSFWFDAQSPDFYDAKKWEPCACGYGGKTRVRLSTVVPPLARQHQLRFEVYRGGGEEITVPFDYAGPDFVEYLSEQVRPWLGLAKTIKALIT